MCLDILSYGDNVGYSSSNLACNIYKSHSLLSLPVLSVIINGKIMKILSSMMYCIMVFNFYLT